MPEQYLSTDPNAGLETGYLSMDPNAGDPPPSPKKASPDGTLRVSIGDRLAAAGSRFGEHLKQNVITTPKEMLQGAGAGLMSSAFHGGDLIRRGLGMERVIDTPEAQRAMTPPQTTPGKVGFIAEQGAEFMAPAGRVLKATAGRGLLTRMAAESATGAGVAGLQTGGDPTATGVAAAIGPAVPMAAAIARPIVGAVRRGAAGAAEGGLGGALAATVRGALPENPSTMMVQALKPRATQAGFERALARAMPELKATEDVTGKAISGVDDLLEATKAAKQRVREQYDALAGPRREMGSTVDLTPVATAMAKSIPKKTFLEEPGKAAAILERASVYRNRFSLEQAEQLLKETNAELSAFYNKYPAAQRRALTADPEAAQLVAQGDALRSAIYQMLDAPGQGRSARELQRRYGALLELEETAVRRANVAKRQQPESLAEQLGTARAYGDIARGTWRVLHGDLTGAADIAGGHATRKASKALKENQTADALIRRAMAGFRGRPETIDIPSIPRPKGLLGKAPIEAGPAPDRSYVRSVPAEYPKRPVRGLLPEGRRVRQMPASTIDSSEVTSKPAAVITREFEGRNITRRQYSSDPNAVDAPMVDVSPDESREMRRMLVEMESVEFTPRTFREAGRGRGGDLEVTGGAAGAPVYQDILDQHPNVSSLSRAEVEEIIRNTLAGRRSALSEAIIEVARKRLKGDWTQVSKPILPPDAGDF